MKTINLLRKALIMTLFAISFSSCETEGVIPANQLPPEITNYISLHFPNNAILRAVEENGFFAKTYEVFLDGNVHLDFNKKKQIVDIDGVSKLPDSVIPEKLRVYVAANYPKNVIIGWELEGRNQELELNNGLSLEFNINGDFLRIDH